MINERIALLLLNGEAGRLARNNAHYTREFYHCMEGFANTSVATCQAGNLKKFESHLNIAKKLYTDGNETVKNGVVNVFLYKDWICLIESPPQEKLLKSACPKSSFMRLTASIIAAAYKLKRITYRCDPHYL